MKLLIVWTRKGSGAAGIGMGDWEMGPRGMKRGVRGDVGLMGCEVDGKHRSVLQNRPPTCKACLFEVLVSQVLYHI